MKLGKATYSNEKKFTKKKYFKLKDGEQTFRILPPLGELADRGVWSKYYAVHFGYTDSQGKLRPFTSPEVKNNKTKMIEKPDAAKDRLEKMKAELIKAKEEGNEELVEKLTKLCGFGGQYNLDKNYYMNVIDSSGNIGILQLRHKAFQALIVEIKKLRDQGVDPLSAEDGREFTFSRTGTMNETAFKVEVAQEVLTLTIDGKVKKVKEDRVSVLTDEIISRLAAEAGNLADLFPCPTSEEVARIVNEGPTAVDEILVRRSKKNEVETPVVEEEEVVNEEDMVTKPLAPKTTSTPVVAKTEKVSPKETVAKTAPKATQTAKPTETTTNTPTKVDTQSSEEFLKSLGL